MSTIGQYSTHRLPLPMLDRITKASNQITNQGVDGHGPATFLEFMQSGISGVNRAQHDASAAVNELMTGGDIPEVEVFSAVQKADMAFRMLVQVRNKLMQAYEEINAIRI